MCVWLGARLDCRFRTGIWKRATEGRALSFDVPVSLHSTAGSAPQQSSVRSSEGFGGDIGIVVWTDTAARSPRGFRISSTAVQY